MRVVADMQAGKNRQIMHSIDYASTIQRSMLRPSREALAKNAWRRQPGVEPRDVVGGDFYHFAAFEDGWFAALADCTGHGVPGAFLTLISSSILIQAIEQRGPRDPGALLAAVNRGIKQMLGQIDGDDDTPGSNDGMDAAFFWFDNAGRRLAFAGAKSALFVLQPGDEEGEIPDGERTGVGYVDTDLDFAWRNRVIQTQPRRRGVRDHRRADRPDRRPQGDCLWQAPYPRSDPGKPACLGGSDQPGGAGSVSRMARPSPPPRRSHFFLFSRSIVRVR
ncbi:SpoIIE family protein phosphatase [Bradyrhizobium betae]